MFSHLVVDYKQSDKIKDKVSSLGAVVVEFLKTTETKDQVNMESLENIDLVATHSSSVIERLIEKDEEPTKENRMKRAIEIQDTTNLEEMEISGRTSMREGNVTPDLKEGEIDKL